MFDTQNDDDTNVHIEKLPNGDVEVSWSGIPHQEDGSQVFGKTAAALKFYNAKIDAFMPYHLEQEDGHDAKDKYALIGVTIGFIVAFALLAGLFLVWRLAL